MNFAKIFGGTNTPLGYAVGKKTVPKGFSADRGYQNQAPAGYTVTKSTTGAGRDGLKVSYGRTPYYEVTTGPAPAAAPGVPNANKPSAAYTPTALPTSAAPASPDYSKYEAQVASLNSALSGLQSQLKANSAAYAKSIADQQKNFDGMFANQQSNFNKQIADQTTKYDNNMSALRNSLSETMSNKAQPVMGVKSGAYGQQTAAMQRQGIKGTFSRSGLRIKGIKDNSLNI